MIDICKFLTSEHVQIFKIPVQKINVYFDVWFVDILYDPIDHLKKFITTVLGLFDLSNKVNLFVFSWLYEIHVYKNYLYSDT